MRRELKHQSYVEQPYEEICQDLDRDGQELIGAATSYATAFAADLANYLDQQLGFFDRDEQVTVEVGAFDRGADLSSLSLTWKADAAKRLLPNVTAMLELRPIVPSGPAATSELTLKGWWDPAHLPRRSVMHQVLAGRVVDATLHTLLTHLTKALSGSP